MNFISDPLPEDFEEKIIKIKHRGVQTARVKPMLNETKALLDDFHRPYKQRLAKMLSDDRFLWQK